ncbi:MAG: hypothetical protein HKO65_18805 [Gemmatimonadetes bacterium]|nr:hypothetical protein [Gemmatimonadota bacterium]NNM07150.1 hypothetical protein [Gemmatimonadota bacterium]
MTPQAVVLLMAGNTRLQVLPSGLRVAQDPNRLVVMERGYEAPSTLHTQIQVAFPAETL